MKKIQVDRRTALLFTGFSFMNLLQLRGKSFAATTKPFEMTNLQNNIADTVRKIANDRKVKLVVLYPDGSLANLKPISNEFTEKTGVEIKYRKAPTDDINSQILLSHMTRKSDFDIALPATFGIPDLAQLGAIRPLDDFAAQYEPKEYQDESLYSVGDYYKGRLYGYQTDGDAYIMFYNKKFLEDPIENERYSNKFGRPLRVPHTWLELDETMEFFHRPDENKYGGSLFRTADYLPWEWWIRFHSKGYFPLDEEMNPQINNEAGILALKELIAASEYLDPRTKTDGLFENWASFAEGNSFCNIGWGGSQKHFNRENSKIRGKIAFGPTPGGIVNGSLLQTPYFNWGWNYVVSANSAEPEIAYLFSLFACSPDISKRSVSETGGFFDPFRPQHYDAPEIIETYSEAFLNTQKHSMENAIPDLYLNGQSKYFGVLRECLAKAAAGERTPEEALNRAAQQWRLITFQLGRESQLEQWNFLKSQYPKEIKNILK